MDTNIIYIIGAFMLIDAVRGILRWNTSNVLSIKSKRPIPPFVEETNKQIRTS
jgi:hypothetical protein